MHRVLFHIWSFEVYSYGFFIALAIVVSLCLMNKNSARYGVPFDAFVDAFTWVVIAGIAGGRLLFVLINWQNYIKNPIAIFALREGGMAFQGSLVAGFLAGVWACRVKKIAFWKAADLLAPYIALGEAIGRIGCFMNGCCYGKVTTGMFGVVFPGETVARIPSQIFLSVALLVLYLFLDSLGRKKHFDGFLFASYLILYSGLRFFLDMTRADNPAIWMNMTLAQAVSAAVFVSGLIVYVLQSRKRQ